MNSIVKNYKKKRLSDMHAGLLFRFVVHNKYIIVVKRVYRDRVRSI